MSENKKSETPPKYIWYGEWCLKFWTIPIKVLHVSFKFIRPLQLACKKTQLFHIFALLLYIWELQYTDTACCITTPITIYSVRPCSGLENMFYFTRSKSNSHKFYVLCTKKKFPPNAEISQDRASHIPTFIYTHDQILWQSNVKLN